MKLTDYLKEDMSSPFRFLANKCLLLGKIND